ncbi:DegT/DnrJ/EryC1/StrS aminotransferase family protein [Promicromonospora sp. NPDC023805]|uniref:DegT/DnrJ/EryC1/StrS family aminotransferase n=1 Tax=Promicromonospora sp. NPDC023805 TaxID=3154696 RepID=UPI00340BB8AE
MNRKPAPWPSYSALAVARVSDLIQRGATFDYAGSGPVAELESEFSRYQGGRHVVSFNSGTSALFAAFAALGLEPGAEVLVPSWTFFATASPLLWLGATPVLVDSGSGPGVSATEFEKAITARTRAIVTTHLFGDTVELDALVALARDRGLPLVTDCSHAHATTFAGAPIGTFGDIAVFSVGARKMISGGHGGLLVTADSTFGDLATLVGHFKPRTRNRIRSQDLRRLGEFALGGNLRMSPLSATLALDHLERIDQISGSHLANIEVLDSAFLQWFDRPPTSERCDNRTRYDIVYQLRPGVPTSARDALVAALSVAEVPARPPATRPVHRVLATTRGGAPATHALVRRLQELASDAGSDLRLPSSASQHDRMISLESEYFYGADTTYSSEVARRAERALANAGTARR